MKKSAIAAAALVGVSALTGSAVLPGSATTAAPVIHTKKLVLHNTAESYPSTNTNVGTDVVRSGGKLVGYDSYTGRIFPKTGDQVARVAFALKDGIILARMRNHRDGIHGPIVGGAGKYRGVRGTITLRLAPNGEHVTLRYHF